MNRYILTGCNGRFKTVLFSSKRGREFFKEKKRIIEENRDRYDRFIVVKTKDNGREYYEDKRYV